MTTSKSRWILITVLFVALALAMGLCREEPSDAPGTSGAETASPLPTLPAAPAADATVSRRTAEAIETGGAVDSACFVGELIAEGGGELPSTFATGDVVIAAASDLETSAEGTDITFRAFVFGQGAPIPCAIGGQHHAIHAGRWNMPIPTEPLALVEVKSNGRSWQIVQNRAIPTGSRHGTFSVRAPAQCDITVVGTDGRRLEGSFSLRATTVIPDGVPIRIVSIGSTETAREPEPASERFGTAPPNNAVRVAETTTNPIVFDSADHTRDLWVGKDGCQWERIRWMPSDRHREVRLSKAVDLRIHLAGVEGRGGSHSLHVARDGSPVAMWSPVIKDAIYTLRGIGSGTCRVAVRRETNAGPVVLVEKELQLAEDPVVDVDIAVAATASANGEILVGYYDPEALLTGKDLLTIRSHEGAAGPTTHRLSELRDASFHRQTGVGQALLRGIAPGQYFVAIGPLAEVRSVRVDASAQAVVNFDLGGFAAVKVRLDGESAKVVPAKELVLCWQYAAGVDQPEPYSGLASTMTTAASQVVKVDDAWFFRARPGRVALWLRSLGSGSIESARIVTVRPGENDFAMTADQSDAMGLVRLSMEQVPPLAMLRALSAIDRLLAWDGAVRPALAGTQSGREGQMIVDLLLPEGTGVAARVDADPDFECIEAPPGKLVVDRKVAVSFRYRRRATNR